MPDPLACCARSSSATGISTVIFRACAMIHLYHTMHQHGIWCSMETRSIRLSSGLRPQSIFDRIAKQGITASNSPLPANSSLAAPRPKRAKATRKQRTAKASDVEKIQWIKVEPRIRDQERAQDAKDKPSSERKQPPVRRACLSLVLGTPHRVSQCHQKGRQNDLDGHEIVASAGPIAASWPGSARPSRALA